MGLLDILNLFDAGRASSALPKINSRALPVIATAVTLLYTSYQLGISLRKKECSKYKEIPMPTEGHYPILGHLPSLGTESQLEEKIAVWHKQLGPIIKLQFGVQTWFFVDDPQLAHRIFVTNGTTASGRPKTIFRYYYYSNYGKGAAFSQPDSGWRRARSAGMCIPPKEALFFFDFTSTLTSKINLVLSSIAPQKIKEHKDTIKNESTALLNRILDEIENGRGEMFPLKQVQMATFNLALSLCVGKRFDSLEDEEYKILVNLLDENLELEDLKYEVPNFIPALYYPLHFLMGRSKIKSWVKECNTIFPRLIEEAIEKDGDNLVKSLHKNGSELTQEELIVVMGDFLGGGTDTSLITLLWIIKFMAIYPEVQKKAATEIAQFISSNGYLPQFDERGQLPYCICVIKECMRLRPTVPFGVPHTATEDIEVDGYFIPKGRNIISSMRSMHRNPSFFPDEPEKFKPERYMSNLKTMHAAANGKLEERDQFNFGWGRRGCPAPYLAEMELFSVFTTLLSECAIEPASSGVPDMNTDKKAFFEVKFTKRLSTFS